MNQHFLNPKILSDDISKGEKKSILINKKLTKRKKNNFSAGNGWQRGQLAIITIWNGTPKDLLAQTSSIGGRQK